MGPIVLLVAIIGASVIGRELPAARARPLRETAARDRCARPLREAASC